MTIAIKSIVHNGEHYVSVVMDGQPMERHGPFARAGEAEAMAVRFAAVCRALACRSGHGRAEVKEIASWVTS